MLLLRLYLLGGLVIHKVIWEILRTAGGKKKKNRSSASVLLIKAVKILILLGIIVQTMLPHVFPIVSEPFLIKIIGTALYTVGLLTAIAARFQLGENWANIETGQVLDKQEVVGSGIYGFIRHPIYTGDLLLLVGLELALNSWLVIGAALLIPIVTFKAIKEERMLVKELSGYESYCSRTKRFIPYIF